MKSEEHKFLNAVETISKKLAESNNIDGYINQKKYSIIFNCSKNLKNENIYSIKIIQGTSNPKLIISKEIIINKNIDKNIDKMILNLITDKNFGYTSFSKAFTNKLEYEYFNINFNNSVEVKFKINTEEELKRYKIIKDLSQNVIIKFKKNIETTNKDDLQKQKAECKIETAITMIDLLKEKNYFNNYLLTLKNSFVEERNCYVYNIKIISKNKKNVIYDRNFSIVDKENLKNILMKLLKQFGEDENFIYSSTSKNYKENIFNIKTNNNIDLEVIYSNEQSDMIYPNYKEKLNKKIKKIKND